MITGGVPERLRTRVNQAAHRLAEHAGERVAIDAGTALDRLCWFLGADLAGAAALVVEPTWTARERAAVLADARPSAVVTGTPSGPSHDFAPVGDAGTHFYLPTTSGSSGRPKVLVRSRRSWLDSFAALDLGLGPDDVVLVPGPLSSSLFLFGALHALHSKAEVHLLERWSAAEAAESRATVVHLVPAMLSALLPELAGSPLRTVVCAGARLDPALRSRLRRSGRELVEYYGSAEQSLIAVDRGDGLRPVVDVEARDGQLWARSDLVFDGYLENGVRRFPAGWQDGWSSVGDRGVLHEDGTLEVRGRSSSVLNSGARMVSAEDVESVLRDVEGVRDVLVSATPHPRFGDLVTALVEVDAAAPPSLRALRAHARETLEPAKRPRRWLATTELPRTAAGKLARTRAAEQLRDGTFEGRAL